MKAPQHLDSEGSTFWKDMVDEYGITDSGGMALLTATAEFIDRAKEARDIIDEHGVVVSTAAGGLKTNPACGVEKDAKNGFLAAMRALNLDLEPLRDRVGRPTGN